MPSRPFSVSSGSAHSTRRARLSEPCCPVASLASQMLRLTSGGFARLRTDAVGRSDQLRPPSGRKGRRPAHLPPRRHESALHRSVPPRIATSSPGRRFDFERGHSCRPRLGHSRRLRARRRDHARVVRSLGRVPRARCGCAGRSAQDIARRKLRVCGPCGVGFEPTPGTNRRGRYLRRQPNFPGGSSPCGCVAAQSKGANMPPRTHSRRGPGAFGGRGLDVGALVELHRDD